ncbi:MAG TPA: glycosyltransferase family 39 protein [Candidatus Binataceae bacterium]|nr:glycosyltransferase family 39 protein [Candidatus Binataceae bacterium]
MPELSETMPDPSDPSAEPGDSVRSGRGSIETVRARWAQIATPANAVALLTVAALVLRLLYLGSRDLWLDEAASAKFASYSWPHFAKAVTFWPVNMTFYFAVLHVWTSVMGDSEFMLRMPSVLAAAATVPLVYLLGTKLLDRRAGLVAAVLMTVNVASVDFSQEARSYTLVVMLAALSSLFFVQSLSKPSLGNCAAYVVATVCCIYSHMFGILLLPAQWLSLVFFLPGWKPAVRLTISAAVIGLIAVPHFALALGGNIVHLNWVQRTSPQRVYEFLALITGVGDNLKIAEYYLIACAAIAAVVALFDRSARAPFGFLMLGVFVPAAIILVVSQYKPLFWPRYLLVSQPFFAVLAGLAISRLRPWPITVVVLIPIVVFCVQKDFAVYQRAQREDWPDAVRYMASNAQPGDVYMVFIPFGRQPIDYYRKRLVPNATFPALVYPDPNIDIPDSPDVSVEDLFAVPHQRIWLVSTGGSFQPAPFRRAGKEPPEFSSVLRQMRLSSYQLENLKRFGSVREYVFVKVAPSS